MHVSQLGLSRSVHNPSRAIVVVTHYFPSHGGGIELVASKLVAEYLRAGFNVDWFASATDEPPPTVCGLHVHPVRASNLVEHLTQLPYPIWSPGALFQLWRAIRTARAVHVHEHVYMGSLAAILIGRLLRKRVVLTQHTGAVTLPTRTATAIYSLCTRLLAIPMMNAASAVAFVSSNVQSFFACTISRLSRQELVFNGIDESVFRFTGPEDRRVIKEQMELRSDTPVTIFAGRFVRKKGLQLLRDLAGRMPDVTWLFAGAGPEDPAHWKLSNVRSLGYLSQPALSRALRAADALVLPSFCEGFPLVVQEALACGTAVLATREVATACPAAAELILSEELRGDVADGALWENKLRQLFQDHNSSELRNHRSKQAHQLWSWRRCGAAYLGLLGVHTREGSGQR